MHCVVLFLRRALVVALAAALGSGTALAQGNQVRLTGKIIDKESGQPIPFAQIQIVGTNLGTQTNQQGVYLVRGLPTGGHTVRVIALGYQSSQQGVYLNAAQETTLDFVLAKAAFQLEAVVTTATGQQLTRELGNSIAKIETAKLVQEQPITAMQDVLNGRTAGVTLIQSNGTVGGGSRVRVRGISSASLSNDRLVIVDGVRVENGSPNIDPSTVGQTSVGGGRPSFLNDLNPEEIEDIEIVKGPSAATLYGTESANGVIVVTTKRGKTETPRRDLFAALGSSVDPYEYPGQYYNLGKTTAGQTIDCVSWRRCRGSARCSSATRAISSRTRRRRRSARGIASSMVPRCPVARTSFATSFGDVGKRDRRAEDAGQRGRFAASHSQHNVDPARSALTESAHENGDSRELQRHNDPTG